MYECLEYVILSINGYWYFNTILRLLKNGLDEYNLPEMILFLFIIKKKVQIVIKSLY